MIKTTPHTKKSGFTTVELMVALFIGVLFITAGYQLYMILLKDGAESRDRALASSLASSQLDKKAATTAACSPTPVVENIPVPAETKLIEPSISSSTSWPYGCSGAVTMKRIEITVSYGEPDKRSEVKHARLVQG